MTDLLDNAPEALRERLARAGLEFLIEFLEVETRLHPENADAVSELGSAYTRQGRYEDGLAQDRRLVRLVPDNPTARYNLACSLCLTGDAETALEVLRQACDLGFADHLEQDEDLVLLRDDSRFRSLVNDLRAGRIGPAADLR
jgi:Flp pilus assembly protein TadD